MIEFHAEDITRIALEENSFDTIIIHFVLHDIEPENRKDIVNRLATLLRPEGTLHIREPAKPGHGMQLSEIRELMRIAGLREHRAGCFRSMLWQSICDGVFLKSW